MDQNQVLVQNLEKFVNFKRLIAVCLVPILLVLAFYSLGDWSYKLLLQGSGNFDGLKNVNSVFFDEFFTILIIEGEMHMHAITRKFAIRFGHERGTQTVLASDAAHQAFEQDCVVCRS